MDDQEPCPLLRAVSDEAVSALQGKSEIALSVWPFRVGRESRTLNGPLPRDIAERRTGKVRPTNDLYLLDEAFVKFVSREHFQIEKSGCGDYLLRDCGSVCGVEVAGKWIGGERRGGTAALNFGVHLRVGGPDSPYEFAFVPGVTPGRE